MFSLIKEYEQSGLTIAAFCSSKDIKAATFNYWRRKQRDSGSDSKGFIPIPIPFPAHGENSSLRLAYPNGVSIHLPVADMALIAQLLRLA